MNMDITYEDGLRLSELNGQLAQMQYNLDHLDLTVLPDMAWIAIFVGLAMIAGSWGLYIVLTDCKGGPNSKGQWVQYKKHDINPWVWLAGTIVVCLVLCMLAYYGLELVTTNTIQSDMSNVQAQIDTILSKYGS